MIKQVNHITLNIWPKCCQVQKAVSAPFAPHFVVQYCLGLKIVHKSSFKKVHHCDILLQFLDEWGLSCGICKIIYINIPSIPGCGCNLNSVEISITLIFHNVIMK